VSGVDIYAEAVERATGGLVGSTAAARILGVHKGNFKRHRHLLTAIPVEDGHDVYARLDVEALAARWRAER
jgi:hypothetical protein